MKKNNLLRYWPLTLFLAAIALLAVLVVSSTPAQAISSPESSALQETPPAVTVPAPTVVIPQTGGDTIIIDFFSSWVFWAIIGLLVVVSLFALVIRPRSTPPDIHHHHDV